MAETHDQFDEWLRHLAEQHAEDARTRHFKAVAVSVGAGCLFTAITALGIGAFRFDDPWVQHAGVAAASAGSSGSTRPPSPEIVTVLSASSNTISA